MKKSAPLLNESDIQAIQKCLSSGEIAVGSQIETFEKNFAQSIHAKYAVSTNNGFGALVLALSLFDVKSGDEVIIPCISTCHAIRNAVLFWNATPIYCDTEYESANLDLSVIKKLITTKTKAIIAVEHFGVLVDTTAYSALGIPIILDCAHSLGFQYIQGFQKRFYQDHIVSTYSFYPTKLMTTIDGGMVATNSKKYYQKLLDMRYYGGCFDDRKRLNLKMQNVHAALGINQLKRLPDFIEQRKQIANNYDQLFDIKNNIHLEEPFLKRCTIPYRYLVKVKKKSLMAEIKHIYRTLEIPFGEKELFVQHSSVLKTENYHYQEHIEGLLSLPFHCEISSKDQQQVVAPIIELLKTIQ